jgi:hypothetical protein
MSDKQKLVNSYWRHNLLFNFVVDCKATHGDHNEPLEGGAGAVHSLEGGLVRIILLKVLIGLHGDATK